MPAMGCRGGDKLVSCMASEALRLGLLTYSRPVARTSESKDVRGRYWHGKGCTGAVRMDTSTKALVTLPKVAAFPILFPPKTVVKPHTQNKMLRATPHDHHITTTSRPSKRPPLPREKRNTDLLVASCS